MMPSFCAKRTASLSVNHTLLRSWNIHVVHGTGRNRISFRAPDYRGVDRRYQVEKNRSAKGIERWDGPPAFSTHLLLFLVLVGAPLAIAQSASQVANLSIEADGSGAELLKFEANAPVTVKKAFVLTKPDRVVH